MNILYVTTFTLEMFKASGKMMIESFMKNRCDGTMLVCSEYFKYNPKDPGHLESRKSRRNAEKHNKIISYDMTKDKFLKKWIQDNQRRLWIVYYNYNSINYSNCGRSY